MAVELRLKVALAKPRDAGRGKVRINNHIMRELNVTAGTILVIQGQRLTTALAWPAYREDRDNDVVRMDTLTMFNADISFNEYVFIKPADVKDAQTLVLTPITIPINADGEFTNLVKTVLLETAFVSGDLIIVNLLGDTISCTVTHTTPTGIVKITPNTKLAIQRQPQKPVRYCYRFHMMSSVRLSNLSCYYAI